MREFAEIEDRLGGIRAELERIGRPDTRIIAVTKGFGVEAWQAAARLGLDTVGESYAQELQAKLAGDRPDIGVHFIGRIQRNKVRKVIDDVDVWHSVARPEILTELGRRRPGARALLQLSVADDPTKDGITADQVETMLEVAQEADVQIEGFMTIGLQGDADASRAAFEAVDRLATEHGLVERSMGMSNDWQDAAAAGSTLLRLGSVLFGPRP